MAHPLDRRCIQGGTRVVASVLDAPAREPVRPVAEDTPRLTADEIQRFHSDGFLSIPSVMAPDEASELIPAYDRFFAERVGYAEGDFFDFAGKSDDDPMLPQMLMPSRHEPRLRRSIAYRRCLTMACQLLGGQAEHVFDHAMVKPPGAPATRWHQDQAFWGAGMRHRTITFWIPLQDVFRENGCLKFIPGSNTGPLLPHRPLDDDPGSHGLEALGAVGDTAVYCPLPAGGATVHHWLTLHGADANTTAITRRAYALCFGVEGDEPLVAREYPWNLRKDTARERRHLASLRPWPRLKRRIWRQLNRLRDFSL
jgi:phytanoyl-CoA dioxygenase PhyH